MAAADVEAVDFEPDEDDLMDEDGTVDVDVSPVPQPLPKLRSTITGGRSTYAVGESSGVPRKTKGRGFREEGEADRNNRLAAKDFDSLDSDGTQGPQRCELLLFLSLSCSIRRLILFPCSACFVLGW